MGFERDPALSVDCGNPGAAPEKGRLKSKETVYDIQCLIMFFLLLLILNDHFITCETCLRITLILSCNSVLIRVL